MPEVRAVAEPEPVIIRGEWLRRPERRNDLALLETKSGSAAVMVDRQAVLLACLALGIVVERCER